MQIYFKFIEYDLFKLIYMLSWLMYCDNFKWMEESRLGRNFGSCELGICR